MPSDLRFPPTYEARGFSTHATTQHAGNPEPIVRELLQNGLDAAKEADRGTQDNPAEVVFVISERPKSDLPGLDAYERAFRAAEELRRERQGGNLSADEKRVIERINGALSANKIRFLFCRDNGVGLGDIECVLFEGNTSKGSSGGGSFGVGHMTAFAASDLRYILYAGRASAASTAGGHAILAAYAEGGTLKSADGYYTRDDDLFSDCPLARAYWRRRVAVDAAAQAQGRLTVESAHNALHRSGQIWETFVLAAIKRLTVLNHPKTRAALVAHIAATPKITREEIAESGRRLARRGLSYSLDMLSWDELVEIAAGGRPASPTSQRSGLGRILRR